MEKYKEFAEALNAGVHFTGRYADTYKMNSYSLSYSFIIHKDLRLGQVTVYLLPPPPVRVELTF